MATRLGNLLYCLSTSRNDSEVAKQPILKYAIVAYKSLVVTQTGNQKPFPVPNL